MARGPAAQGAEGGDGAAGDATQRARPKETWAKTRGGEANVQRILDAALAVFATEGFAGARIDAIAAKAGLSKPNLLYYFRTKQELYLAALRRTLDTWLVPLARIEADSDPARRADRLRDREARICAGLSRGVAPVRDRGDARRPGAEGRPAAESSRCWSTAR